MGLRASLETFTGNYFPMGRKESIVAVYNAALIAAARSPATKQAQVWIFAMGAAASLAWIQTNPVDGRGASSPLSARVAIASEAGGVI